MANIQSAKKRIKQDVERTRRNKMHLNRVRTFLRKLESFITEGKKTDANAALVVVTGALHRAAQRGIVKKNLASRKISRLSAHVKSL